MLIFPVTWQRGRDSNPRWLAPHTRSRRAPSTTRPPLYIKSVRFWIMDTGFIALNHTSKIHNPKSEFKSWPGDRDSNPGRCDPQRFSRPPLSTTQPSPETEADNGGGTRIRTGDQGFAGPCLTTWLCRHTEIWCPEPDLNRHEQMFEGF